MSAIATAEIPSGTHSNARVSLNAFEILHVIHDTRTTEKRAAARSRWVWIGATVVGALVCWQMVADHFALTREVDTYVSLVVTQAASQNGVINHAINIASEATVLTGGLLIALVWACWFNDSTKAARERLLLGFGAVLITAVLSRVLQVSLPVRLRPMHDLASGFLPLPGLDPTLAHHWGSFPSDHAALFFALVTVICQRSRWLGLLALVSALYGVLPRIYVGLHYFSDVAAGAVLGVAFVLLFERFGPSAVARRGVGWEQRLPGVFYGTAFLASLEVATLFEDIRQVGRGIPAVLKQLGTSVVS
jgi:undecaprenyl-diphosphatase